MLRRARKEIGPHPDQGVWLRQGSDPRWAPTNPSVELQLLKLEAPRIYNQQPDRLCEASSKNFCGALFFALHHKDFLRSQIKHSFESIHNLVIPNEVALPFRILRNVPLFAYEKTKRDHVDLHRQAPLVLYKQASGSEAAVVLQGSLAGLILDKYDALPNAAQGMTVNRVWNDELIDTNNLPYSPYYSAMEDHLHHKDAQKLDELYDEKFLAYLKKEGFNTPIWTVDLFFHLCNKLEIPLDKKAFYYLRSAEALNKKSNLRHTR